MRARFEYQQPEEEHIGILQVIKEEFSYQWKIIKFMLPRILLGGFLFLLAVAIFGFTIKLMMS